jgi:hypothetical protein
MRDTGQNNYANNKHGSAMAMVVMVFAVLMVIVAAMAFMFSANTDQTMHQEEYSRAYYLANSGVEIGLAALLTDVGTPSTPEYYYERYASVLNTPRTHTENLSEGTVTIILSRQMIDGEVWLVIDSTGQLSGGGLSQTLKYRFRADNPALIVRE